MVRTRSLGANSGANFFGAKTTHAMLMTHRVCLLRVRGRIPRFAIHGDVMNDHERANYSRVAADAVAVALRLARLEMPEASDARLLLMILGNVAACCGRHRIEYPDVLRIVSGLYYDELERAAEPSCTNHALAMG
jgi:hypothetical protein